MNLKKLFPIQYCYWAIIDNMRKFTVDFNFFENIDTEEKAYTLGFLYADGCIASTLNKIQFDQLEPQEDILFKIKEVMQAEAPIHTHKGKHNRTRYRLLVCSKKMCQDLLKLGIIPNKSLTLTFPTKVPQEFLRHFIRGYFDGDGCIWIGNEKE